MAHALDFFAKLNIFFSYLFIGWQDACYGMLAVSYLYVIRQAATAHGLIRIYIAVPLLKLHVRPLLVSRLSHL